MMAHKICLKRSKEMVEIDRELFVTLQRDEPTTYMYYILCDLNYRDKFYAENDEKAKEIFREKINKNRY